MRCIPQRWCGTGLCGSPRMPQRRQAQAAPGRRAFFRSVGQATGHRSHTGAGRSHLVPDATVADRVNRLLCHSKRTGFPGQMPVLEEKYQGVGAGNFGALPNPPFFGSKCAAIPENPVEKPTIRNARREDSRVWQGPENFICSREISSSCRPCRAQDIPGECP